LGGQSPANGAEFRAGDMPGLSMLRLRRNMRRSSDRSFVINGDFPMRNI